MLAAIKDRFPSATKRADDFGIWFAVWQIVSGIFVGLGSFAPFMEGANFATWVLFYAIVAAGILLLACAVVIAYRLVYPASSPSVEEAQPTPHDHSIKCESCGHPNVYLSSKILGHEGRVEILLNIGTTKPYRKLSVYVTPQLGTCVMGGLGTASGDCHWKNLASNEAFAKEDVPSDFSKKVVAFEIINGHLDSDGATYQLPRATRFHAVIKFDDSEETDDIVISTVRGPNGFIAYVESYGPDLKHWSPAIKA